MCGRYGLFRDPKLQVRAVRGRVPDGFRFAPQYNVAPQQRVLGITNGAGRDLRSMRWGLVTNVSGDPRGRISTINARIETLATSPLYGPLLEVRRCVLFADGYYEWHVRPDGIKQPVWIERIDGTGCTFAGLWNETSERGETLVACTIVTQPANSKLAALHERMPAVLDATRADRWLESEPLRPETALELLAPASGDEWTYHPVSTAVGNVRNDSPALIVAAAPLSEQPSLFGSSDG